MTRPEQLANFLDTFLDDRAWAPRSWPRQRTQLGSWPPIMSVPGGSWYPTLERATVDELAQQLVESAEFKALNLGTWLGTADGQLILQAIGMISSPLYRQDAELFAAALQHAAQMQHEIGRKRAGRLALVAVIAFVAVVLASAHTGGQGTLHAAS
jgi:hypothetical protein